MTGRYTVEAIALIERNRNTPFLLYLPHTIPHVRLFASERLKNRPAGGTYGDVVEELDWSACEALAARRCLGLDNRTIVHDGVFVTFAARVSCLSGAADVTL